MKNAQIVLLTICTMVFCQNFTYAQFTVSGEFRPRAEYRHGFYTLPDIIDEPAFFIDQRSRLNFLFLNDNYELKFVVQDVRVWGSQPQLVANDGHLTTIHEAWAKVKIFDPLYVKLGRQEIIYDDHRIFGNVGWAQQARSHDAAILAYEPENLMVHVGLAFNQGSPGLFGTYYNVPNSYKAFQYVYAKTAITDNFKVSALFLNNGLQGGTPANPDIYYSQTFGPRLSYNSDKLNANFAYYKQVGNEPAPFTSLKVNASYLGLDATYKLMDNTSFTAGLEYLSGNDPTSTVNENNAFNPFYGTNHKFNGFMDYFYVGNHINNVGLQDIFLGINHKFGKFSGNLTTHFFSSAETFSDVFTGNELNRYLGTEMDLVLTYKAANDVTFNLGYSQMFATESMEALKGGSKDETTNWAWAMLTIKPTFFTTKKEENAN